MLIRYFVVFMVGNSRMRVITFLEEDATERVREGLSIS
jgi:hypothetical protein